MEKIKGFLKEGKDIYFVSAITQKGLPELIFQIFKTIKLVKKRSACSFTF